MTERNKPQSHTVSLREETKEAKQDMVRERTYNWTLVVSLIAALAISYFAIDYQMKNVENDGLVLTDLEKEPPKRDPMPVVAAPVIDPFENISILGTAAYVYDVKSDKVLYEKNADTVLPLASITKVMTALVALEGIEYVDKEVVVHAEDIAQEGNSGLLYGERWKFLDLLHYTLITSSNDGASAIASAAGLKWKKEKDEEEELRSLLDVPLPEPAPKFRDLTASTSQHASTTQGFAATSTASTTATSTPADAASSSPVIIHEAVVQQVDSKDYFVERMNELAKDLQLHSLEFNNESGLDISALKSGAYGSARDVAHLFAYAAEKKEDIFAPTGDFVAKYISRDAVSHQATNTNRYVAQMANVMLSKTGYTDLAGGNLGVVFDSSIGTPVVVVVLGSSIEGRFSDVKLLMDAAVKSIAQESR